MSTFPSVKRILRVAIYVRVSTHEQTLGDYTSCDAQIDMCKDLIQSYKADGWVLVEIFSDEGVSSKAASRPAYHRILRDVRHGKIDMVVSQSMDRLQRDLRDSKNFEAFLTTHGAQVCTIKEGMPKKNAVDAYTRNILQSTNEFVRSATIEKICDKVYMKAKKGHWQGGVPSFGYDYCTTTHLLTVNAAESAVIKRIFEEIANGVTLYDLSFKLKKEGVFGRPSRYQGRNSEIKLVERTQRSFTTESLRTIVTNPLYRGLLRVANPEKRTSTDPDRVSDQITMPGKHELIISDDLAEAANKRLNAPRNYGTRMTKADKNGYMLKGIIYCGDCGYAMTPTYSGKARKGNRLHRYYKCVLTNKEGANCGCTVGAVPADAIESAIIGYTREVIKRPEIISATLEATEAALRPELALAEQSLKEINGEHAKLSEYSRNCMAAIKNGVGISDLVNEEWQNLNQQRTKLEDERTQLAAKIRALRIAQPTAADVGSSLQKLDEMIMLLPIDRRKELMHLVFERIEIKRPTASLAWINAIKNGKRPRMFRVEMRMTTDWSAEDLDHTEFAAVKPQANASLKFTVEFPFNSKGVKVRILESDLALELNEDAKPVEPADAAVARENVVLRARRWSDALAEDSDLTAAALAAKEGVSSATLSLHKKILTIAPDILQVLARCRDQTTLQYFSLRRLILIAGKTAEEQKEFFRETTKHITRMRAEKAAAQFGKS